MDEIDEMLGTNSQANNYKTNKNYSNRQNNYSTNRKYNHKNNWREQQNQERQKIYDSMNKMSSIVSKDQQKFKQYLDIQSRFFKYSVGNCLVILEQAPYSTQIKDKNSWEEKGAELGENSKAIKILEPTKSNNGRTYYNPKEVFDVSQTTATKPPDIEYDDRKLLESVILTCEIPRKSVDKLADGTLGAEYNKDENVLYVCKGMDRELLFQTLFQEIGNIEMRNDEESNIKSFRSYCISYMVCKKYGIDVSNYDFSNLPEEIANQKEPKDIRRELDIIRSNFESINARMTDYLQNDDKEKNKSVPER